eukprot:CAMPEP_0202705526 /NCGR_PEP_ID=MMETSP1385-20130828/18063_1 /ASSEMBLY_ACC=CAM_ASM_000861 /TAXON_ID=933848 /ORGANISM="Elphidium margaritaceum" /LENGTH=213 /DNA_ID=CAMNT_0049363771 /DNA_START=27 /DNA_END=668 /DNA_ORIENTATION=-
MPSPPRVRLLVDGYLRDEQNEHTLPKTINHLVFLFCKACYSWSTQYIHKRLQVEEEGTVLTLEPYLQAKNKFQVCVAYGAQTVNQGVSTWTVKCHSYEPNDTYAPFIGVTRNLDEVLKVTESTWCNRGYMFCGNASRIYDDAHWEEDVFDGKALFNSDGDVIEFTLDLEQKVIRIAINNHDYGIAFTNVKDGEYRFAIAISKIQNAAAKFEFL